ncbi:MAG: pyridoxamine 5'-phosphate oxidase family protein [Rhizobiaceae bacterium]|nr:pyridoxamine 5'-phosphate oxidase family protein [Rhizobiaceae bacterium]
MAQQFQCLEQKHQDFILRQQMFFTSTAADGSRINISPREIGALRVLDQSTVIYLDRTGSGNETAAHILADGRMTIMLRAFAGPPQIMRLYGTGDAVNWSTSEFTDLVATHFNGEAPLGARQIMRLSIDLVQTSCGFGVPLFAYEGERASLENWANNKGSDGIQGHWESENLQSMDGLPTGLIPSQP